MKTRYLATRIITAVLQQGNSLNEALAHWAPPTTADISLIKQLCYGCLRGLPRLTAISEQLLPKPFKAKDKDIEILIALGLYQLLEMRIPAHAAVAETVAVAKKLGKTWATGVVNAVLRNFQRQQESILNNIKQNLPAHYGHPAWLLNKLQQAWPDDWQSIAMANNQHPPLTLRVNQQQISRDSYLTHLANQGIAATTTTYAATGITLTTPIAVSDLPGFATGWVSVQDQAAQLAATLLDLQPGQRVLDACAAPGGKTAHILEHQPALNELIAIDKDAKRLIKVKENLTRLSLTARLICADAADTAVWWDGQAFDRILLDAPCSATGVIRRHPDIKFLRRQEDFNSLPAQQLQLLNALWPLLKPEGLLVYATCSIMPEENKQTLAQFLIDQPHAQALPITAEWGQPLGQGRQILPGPDNMDGFYYALIKKCLV